MYYVCMYSLFCFVSVFKYAQLYLKPKVHYYSKPLLGNNGPQHSALSDVQ